MNNKDIKSIRKDNKSNRDKPDNSVKIVTSIFLLVLFLLIAFNYGNRILGWIIISLPVEQPIVVKISPLQQTINATDFKYSWKIINIGSEHNLYMDLNLTNHNDKAINNFEVMCIPDYGTAVVNQNKVNLFEVIQPNASIHIPDYNFGQVTDQVKDVKCKITDISLN